MVPPHDRIVSLIGSVIDHSYGGGASPAVLLIMERYKLRNPADDQCLIFVTIVFCLLVG